MKRLWTIPELIDQWSLSPAERALVDEAREPHTRLGCACLLKYFQLDWRFPRSRAHTRPRHGGSDARSLLLLGWTPEA